MKKIIGRIKFFIRVALEKCLNQEINKYRFEARFLAVISHLSPDLVIDVGCNKGQFVNFLRKGYSGEVISFEPIPGVVNELESKSAFSADERWQIVKCALSDEDASETLNIAGSGGESSSLLEPKSEIELPISERISVDVRTLDSFRFAANNIFLKIDVQGLELQVLKGGTRTFSSISGILVECSNHGFYKGASTLLEIATYLESHGFKMWLVKHNIRSLMQDREYDVLFVNEKFSL